LLLGQRTTIYAKKKVNSSCHGNKGTYFLPLNYGFNAYYLNRHLIQSLVISLKHYILNEHPEITELILHAQVYRSTPLAIS
jgi:hypothetical protein